MNKPTQNQISRRDALKVLGAITGATVLANMPGEWSKPELVSGVLPAHAQTSCGPLTFTSILLEQSNQCASQQPFPGCGGVYTLSVQISAAQSVPLVLQTEASGLIAWHNPDTAPDGTYHTDDNGLLQIQIDFHWTDTVIFGFSFQNESDGCDTIEEDIGCF